MEMKLKLLFLNLLILNSCVNDSDYIEVRKTKDIFEQKMQIDSKFSKCKNDIDGFHACIKCIGILNTGYPCTYMCLEDFCILTE